jgi:CheY-like chemotaxis protein
VTTILVLEDEYAIAEMLYDVLEDEGYTVLRAGNGQEGLDRLAEHQIDVVLSDVMMPVLDGFAFCEAMQSDPTYSSIPLILMSAVAVESIEVLCRCVAFLQKPFALTDLLNLIAQHTTAVI